MERRRVGPMGQVLLFLAAVNSVPWALYFLLRDYAAEGEVWALFAWLLPTVWSPTIVALLLTRWADGPTGIREALGRLRAGRRHDTRSASRIRGVPRDRLAGGDRSWLGPCSRDLGALRPL